MNKEPAVPATPISRSLRRGLVAAAVSIVFLAGCTGRQSVPENYAGAEDDFIAGCVSTAEADAGVEGSTVIADPQAYCQCTFDAISDPDSGISYDRFKEINGDLVDQDGPLPKDIREAFASCDPSTEG